MADEVKPQQSQIDLAHEEIGQLLSMSEKVAQMSPKVRELHADFLLVMKDVDTPDYQERVRKARHDFLDALQEYELKQQLEKEGES